MKRIYTVYSIVWLLLACFVGAVVGSAGSQSAPQNCGERSTWMEE
jgi:hypothetical protein